MLIMLAGPESYRLLRGDFEWDEWLWTTYSNKTWLWFVSMMVIGGSVGYLMYKATTRFVSKKVK